MQPKLEEKLETENSHRKKIMIRPMKMKTLQKSKSKETKGNPLKEIFPIPLLTTVKTDIHHRKGPPQNLLLQNRESIILQPAHLIQMHQLAPHHHLRRGRIPVLRKTNTPMMGMQLIHTPTLSAQRLTPLNKVSVEGEDFLRKRF